MKTFPVRNTKAELKDVSWSSTCNQSKNTIEEFLKGKKVETEVMLVFFLISELAKNNSKVLVAITDDNNFLVEDIDDCDVITIYSPEYDIEADKYNKNKKVLIEFWDLLEHTREGGMNIRFYGSEYPFGYTNIFEYYKEYYEKCKS